MKGFKNSFKFYINSSFHVALAVVCLCDITVQNFGVPGNYKLLLFVFFASITGYNFVKYAGVVKLYHLSQVKNLRHIQTFSFMAFAGLVYLAFYQSVLVLVFSGIMGVFTLLYALPLFEGNKNLRSLRGIKIYVIAFVWAGVTVLLPLIDYVNLWKWDVFLVFMQRFFLVLALTLPFEIRDLQFDKVQLGTIPQKFGVRGTRIIGMFLICVFLLLEFFKVQITFENAVSSVFIGILVIILIRYSALRQSKYYASFWVESVPVFWWLLFTLLRIIT